jgi:hypothetical protein
MRAAVELSVLTWSAAAATVGFGRMRKHWADLAATLFACVAASLLAGQVFRFPFDDEVYTLRLIEHSSFAKLLLSYPATNDVHPPLSYLIFFWLRRLGLSDAGMRLLSLAMTAAALLLFQLLALTWIERRRMQPPPLSTRLAAVLLFGLAPLAISYGDALRWYPLFSLLVALSAAVYFLARRDSHRLAAGALLGLAASTNLLAAPAAFAFAAYRYGLERRFRWQFDPWFWLLVAAFGSLGAYTAYGIAFQRPQIVATQLGLPPLASLPIDILGFLGGERLGIGNGWIVIPAAAIIAAAMLSAIDRKQPASPFHFLLLLAVTVVPLTLTGFAKPRSFLYLAPAVAAIVLLYIDRQAARGFHRQTILIAAAFLVLSAAAIANICSPGPHPFKRELAVPYQQVLDFIEQNRGGRMLVISTDQVATWALRKAGGDGCVEYFLVAERCLDPSQHYASVFVIIGHMDTYNGSHMGALDALIERAKAGREKRAGISVGLDRDAALKSRLTGIPLDDRLLRVELYR